MKKLRWLVVKWWLTGLRKDMQRRIDNGDLDFNDYVYRSRDAAAELLSIWFPNNKKEATNAKTE